MDKIVCLECKKDFKSESSLHRHLTKDGLSQTAYYHKYFPRYDKFDKSIISYKSKDQYFNTDFNSVANLKAWLAAAPKDETRAYVVDYLSKRKRDKKLVYTPTQVELRSLRFPGLAYLNGLFENFNQVATSLGFKNKFNKTFLSVKNDISKQKIIIDTREQKPLKFKLKTITEGLKFGDYILENNSIACGGCIERKSLGDFYTTVSVNFDRFKNEIIRCREAGGYMIIIVEQPLDAVFTYIYQPYLRGKVKLLPEYVLHGMRRLILEFDNIQFLFVNGREEASRVIERIFASGCEFKDVDLQFAYDMKKL